MTEIPPGSELERRTINGITPYERIWGEKMIPNIHNHLLMDCMNCDNTQLIDISGRDRSQRCHKCGGDYWRYTKE